MTFCYSQVNFQYTFYKLYIICCLCIWLSHKFRKKFRNPFKQLTNKRNLKGTNLNFMNIQRCKRLKFIR